MSLWGTAAAVQPSPSRTFPSRTRLCPHRALSAAPPARGRRGSGERARLLNRAQPTIHKKRGRAALNGDRALLETEQI